jgi:hypothetical protein
LFQEIQKVLLLGFTLELSRLVPGINMQIRYDYGIGLPGHNKQIVSLPTRITRIEEKMAL